MRLTFLTQNLSAGGAEGQLSQLALGLSAVGEDVSVIAFYGHTAVVEQLRAGNVRVDLLAKRGRWDLAGPMARLLRIVRGRRPDILHGYLPVPNLLALCLKPFLPGCRVVWGVRSAAMPLDEYGTLVRLSYRLETALAHVPALTIVNSRVGADDLIRRRGFPAERVAVVHNGIAMEWFRPDGAAGARFRRRHGIPTSAPVIGLVGRLDPVKDHVTFLRASARLSQVYNNLHILCAGVGAGDADGLRATADTLGLTGNLMILDWVDETVSLYNALDILVSTSRSEGLSNVILEAMACGTPCVATDVGDSPSVVGGLGGTVAVGDAAGFAAAMEGLLAQDGERRAALSAACRSRVETSYAQLRLIEETRALLAPLARSADR